MKKIIGLLTVLTLILVGCSSDSEGSSNNNYETYIKFKINGQSYNYEPETIVSLKTLVHGYTGNDNTLKRISLWMPNEIKKGTFTITDTPSDEDTYNASYTSEDESIYIDGTSGTITITSVSDDYIKGTFSFNGSNEGTTVNITNGEFKADRIVF